MIKSGMAKLKRMSNAPIKDWPRPMLNTQAALIWQHLAGIPLMDAIQCATESETEELISLIRANEDLID